MSYLNQEQVARLNEIGSVLQQRRIELSLSEEEAAALIHIRVGLLKAIENGQADELPQPVFIQGLLRRYGDALGLDGAGLADTFPISFSIEEPDASVQEVILAPTIPKNLYLIGITGLLAVVAVIGLFYVLHSPSNDSSPNRNPNAPSSQKGKRQKIHSFIIDDSRGLPLT